MVVFNCLQFAAKFDSYQVFEEVFSYPLYINASNYKSHMKYSRRSICVGTSIIIC